VGSAVTGPRFDLALNRSLHMCHGLYATFMPDAAANIRMTNSFLSPTDDAISVYMQVGSKKLGHPFQGHAELLYRVHEGVGVQNSAAHTLSLNMSQFKGHKFLVLIDLSTYPEAKFSGRSLEGQSATLHVENWASTAELARCFISLSHQVIFKVDQDGVRVFN
jgi:hypothetical protein